MSNNKKWEIQSGFKVLNSNKVDDLLKILLGNRGIKAKKEIEEFLNPSLETVTIESVGIDKKQLGKTIKRLQEAIRTKEQIVVFGDYDVDGITSSAILWETLFSLGATVHPYIPHRVDEGYGLSVKGIDNILQKYSKTSLVITVDNGIVADNSITYAKEKGLDVIVTDHHIPHGEDGVVYPKDAYSVVHTVNLCGAGVAWILSQALKVQDGKASIEDEHLELAAIGTVADLVPLTSANRVIVALGLKSLSNTKRVGLLALFREAGILGKPIGAYEVSHMIAPRLNAMGRLESAMDSLRLLCTKTSTRAYSLVNKIGQTNRNRQEITKVAVEHARNLVLNKESLGNLLFLAHESYQQGVIGLIAGRLVEEYYRPAIVISKGELHSKASVRSVQGFNIIEFLRGASEYLVDVGGHPMAAGFTVETAKIELLQQVLEEQAKKLLKDEDFIRPLRIDCELPFSVIDDKFYYGLQKLAPFGMANPEPTFVTKNVYIEDIRLVGKDKTHLKLQLYQQDSPVFEAIAFGMGEKAKELKVDGRVNVVYTVEMNEWNGKKTLQLKIKDIDLFC